MACNSVKHKSRFKNYTYRWDTRVNVHKTFGNVNAHSHANWETCRQDVRKY